MFRLVPRSKNYGRKKRYICLAIGCNFGLFWQVRRYIFWQVPQSNYKLQHKKRYTHLGRPDNCTFFFGRNLINEGRNPPKIIAHNFHFSKYMRYGVTREHRIVLEAALNTKHNTHRQNNQQDEPCHPTLQRLCPLSLHG